MGARRRRAPLSFGVLRVARGGSGAKAPPLVVPLPLPPFILTAPPPFFPLFHSVGVGMGLRTRADGALEVFPPLFMNQGHIVCNHMIHHSFVCVTCLIHMCDMTHPCCVLKHRCCVFKQRCCVLKHRCCVLKQKCCVSKDVVY